MRSGGYALKLSAPVVDLSRSGAINDRQRAQLRDRLLVLDADDQVAALLALRNSVRQLESRVSELQLKLAGMPSAFPAPRPESAKPAPPPVEVAKPAPAKVEPPKAVEAPKVEPPRVEPPKAEVHKPEPPKVEAPKPAASAPKAPVPVVAAPEPAKPAAPPAATESTPWAALASEWMRPALWGLAILLFGIAVLLAAKLARRGARARDFGPVRDRPTELAEEGPIVVAEEIKAPEAPAEPDTGGRAVVSSDAALVTRLAEGDTDDVRRRYIEERFPEIANRTIVLDDADSVVKGARLFYEDGAIPRAVELLQFAVERRPADLKPWLALFEIFRLEALKGEYANLAARFQERHGKSEYWRKVQYFGREIDPGNALYRDEAFKSLETIGPGAARRAAAEQTFDPVTENWLNAPMDFENEVLANDLRRSLMAGAGVSEQDLVPNPMPALRNVEMFRVA